MVDKNDGELVNDHARGPTMIDLLGLHGDYINSKRELNKQT